MVLKYKLLLALAAYVIIAVLAWQTVTDLKLRAFVGLVLGLLAFKSLLFWYKETRATRDGDG